VQDELIFLVEFSDANLRDSERTMMHSSLCFFPLLLLARHLWMAKSENLKARLGRNVVLSTNFVQKRQHVRYHNISTAVDSAALPINTI
jgi:hypothetical protein